MSTVADAAADDDTSQRRPLPAFDRAGWPPGTRQVMAAGATAALAVALWDTDRTALRIPAALLLIEAVLMGLPWRLPRDARSAKSVWAETLAGLLAPLGAIILAALTTPGWLTRSADWWWYAAAVAVGALLFALSGLGISSLFTGEAAFILGSTPRAHARARAFASTVGVVGEELLYRVPVLIVTSSPLGLLAATGFVARHHIQPGTNRRGTARSTVVELTGAALLLALTWWSHSLYPALLAHLLNNLPQIVMELQREHDDRSTA